MSWIKLKKLKPTITIYKHDYMKHAGIMCENRLLLTVWVIPKIFETLCLSGEGLDFQVMFRL